jgi:hypothetical protein
VARKVLLQQEKELTRRSDELARRRRELPWVPVDKEYTFETDEGTKTLRELFDGRSQLNLDFAVFTDEERREPPRRAEIAVRRDELHGLRTPFTMKPCAARPRWTPCRRVLSRAHSAAMGAPCVLAPERPSHPVDEASL